MADLKAKVEKTARYYGSAARKSDARAGFVMSTSEIGEYARDKFEDNFPETSASKYKAHFIATLRSAYTSKGGAKRMSKPSTKRKAGGAKRMPKALPASKVKPVRAHQLVDAACKNKHLPAFLRKRYC